MMLQSRPHDLQRIRRRARDQLRDSGQDNRRLVRDPLTLSLLCSDLLARQSSLGIPGRDIHPPRGVIHSELHRPMADGEHADAQTAVEAEDPFAPEEAHGAGEHGWVGVGGKPVGRQHACLEDPDGVGDDLRGGAGEEGGGEEVGGGEVGFDLGLGFAFRRDILGESRSTT